MKCISCSKETPDIIKFPCPKCKKEISRCKRCRSMSAEYKCTCGFEGP